MLRYLRLKDHFMNVKSYSKLILLAGGILALIQFLSGRSVWMDEAKLAMNIIERSYLELLEPLHSVQVAPIGYLWVQRALFDLFGPHDWVFRLVPLGMYFLGSIALYKVLFMQHIREHVILVMASLFAFCQPLIYYASEIKQYGIDVTLGIVLMYVILKVYKTKTQKIIALSLAGMLAITLSNVAVIILTIAGSYAWFRSYKKTGNIGNELVYPIFLWLVTFGLYYGAFIHNHPTREFMADYWQSFAYMPLQPFSEEFLTFWTQTYQFIFGKILGANPKIPLLHHLFAGACFVGVFTLVKYKKWGHLYLLLGPFFIHIALSALQIYPFVMRVALYLQPFFALLCAIGFVRITEFVVAKVKARRLRFALVLPGLSLLLITLYTFPKDREEFKESYEYMLSRKQSGDHLFLNPGVYNTWLYYDMIGYVKDDMPRTQGVPNREDFTRHHPQLDSLKGRVWFLAAHDYYDDTTYKGYESQYILDYLSDKGATVLDTQISIGSAIYLLEIP